MASRIPMAANTRKARMIDAKEGNLNRTLGVASEHIPAPISSWSTEEEKRARIEWNTQPTVAEKAMAQILGITLQARREPTEAERQATKERIRAYRLRVIRERREVCLQ